MPSGKVVIVTGAGRGIGRAVCVRFAADRGQIVALSRTAPELAETKKLVEGADGQCTVAPTDVTKPDQVEGAMADVQKRFGRIDVLVNCAGVAPLSMIEEMSAEIFDSVWAVNVRAMYVASRAAWKPLKASAGAIVNISSVASRDAFAGFAAYGASKAWVNAWTRALAEEGRPHGVRVFSIAPAGVETGMLRGAFPTYPKEDTLDPADVAEMVYTVVQPACRYATGETIFIQRKSD